MEPTEQAKPGKDLGLTVVAPETQPVGSRGLKTAGGMVFEEYQPELRTLRQRVAVFYEMSRNPYLGRSLRIYERKLALIRYRFEPPQGMEKNARAIDEAAFITSLFTDMASSWEDFLSEVLTMLTYGFAAMERTFKIRSEGNTRHQPDGRIGFADIALRPAETVYQWIWEEDKLKAIKQLLVMSQESNPSREIPADRIYLFRTAAVKNNPEGESLLRDAYEPYVRSKTHRDLEAIGHEKDATGTPIIRVPKEIVQATSGDSLVRKQAANRMARQLKQGQEVGVVISSEHDPDTQKPLYNVELLASPGTKQFDANGIIDRYMREMLIAMGTDFILLGHEKTGSVNNQAGNDQREDALNADINAIADKVCDEFNRRIIPEICDLNGIPNEFRPVMKAPHVQREIPIEQLTKSVVDLQGGGAEMLPDDAVENEIRSRLRLPLKQAAQEV